MGSTVSTGKLVAVFTAYSGKRFYVMFEETYESNCFPRTPRWSCYAIGDLNAVMKAIFEAGSHCEGGMLKGAGGRDVTPEGYIAGWLKELSNPVEFTDRPIKLESGASFNASIPNGQLESAKAKLISLGRDDIASVLEEGKSANFSLYGGAELVAALYDGKAMGPWRIIKSGETPLCGARSPDLGYDPVKAKAFGLDVPRFYKISENDTSRLIQGSDGNWRCEGWDYSYVARYVKTLWEAELREPGSYRARIKAYREAVKSAPCIPKHGVRIVVDTNIALQEYDQGIVNRATTQLPHTTIGNEVRLEMPEEASMLYFVTGLPVSCTKWVITDSAPTEQLCLLAG
ncbi:hypothetical protein [Pseudomonas sp. MWU12-2323]|uniref:hypothetical protein n=1 Tax=Pseudomonas sp. MWU12-2323 TaxID=2651296 RepID=UPI00128B6B26|nr:hypothetical protein [Pseudomonas sp. MWU12-2323]MPQ69430.1 hypothetical protein [Pseudomonas sp. MWU12-2323]